MNAPMNISIDTILTLLFVLYVIISFVSGAGRQVREAQKRAQEEALERELREIEARNSREADPNTQSYESYLERTQKGKVEGDSVPDSLGHSRNRPHFDLPPGAGRDGNDRGTFAGDLAQTGGMSEQERLRQEMARKMGRSAPPPTPPSRRQPQSLEDILREFTQTVEGRQRPTQSTQQPAPQTTGRASSRPTRPTPRPPARPEASPIVPTLRAEMTANVSAAASEGQASVASVREPPAVRGTQTAGTLRSSTRGLGTLGKEDLLRTIVWTEILQPPRSRRR
jgi:hypothetical protein